MDEGPGLSGGWGTIARGWGDGGALSHTDLGGSSSVTRVLRMSEGSSLWFEVLEFEMKF